MNRTNPTILALLAIGIAVSSCSPKPVEWKVESPDGSLIVTVSTAKSAQGNSLYYLVAHKTSKSTDTVILPSPLGLERKEQSFTNGLTLLGNAEIRKVTDDYTLTTGKQRKVHAEANELTVHLLNRNRQPLQVVFRAYNDGVAFRYVFPGNSDSMLTVTSETTGFTLDPRGEAWMQPYDKPDMWKPAYENFYQDRIPIGTAAPGLEGWCFPMLFHTGKYWVLISESGVYENYCACHLQQDCSGGTYRLRFPEASDGNNTGNQDPSWKLPWEMPWRVIEIGQTPGDVLESMLITNLAAPSKIADFSWVKPGRASWSWWSDHPSSKNYQSLKSFVDLAADMGWEYSLVDANWDLMEGGTIEQLVNYANARGVGILMWYNSGGPHNVVTERPRDLLYKPEIRRAEFKKLHEWGVKGVKVDFWQSDKQHIMKYYQDLLKDAAAEHIMVNFHGCTIPKGWSRTWPNLVSMEAVNGAEAYSFNKDYPAKATYINTILPFTRNAVGSMDYTPVTFTDQQFPHLTSWGHELALSVVFESGILHLADRVSAYLGLPKEPLDFLRTVPVVWDETRWLAGEPGQYVVLARRLGDNWWIAGINGLKEPREVSLDLGFIEKTNANLAVIADGEDNKSFAPSSGPFNNSRKLKVKMLPFGGFVATIK